MHDMFRGGGRLLDLREPISFIFDNQSRGKPQIFDAWDSFIENAPIDGKLVGSSPRFEDDVDLPPLQAADFIAWVIRKQAGRAFRGETPPEFVWKDIQGTHQRINRVWNEQELKAYIFPLRREEIAIQSQLEGFFFVRAEAIASRAARACAGLINADRSRGSLLTARIRF
jgi:hypothetical protein